MRPEAVEEAPPPEPEPQGPVIRKEIRKMTADEQERCAAAVLKMMEGDAETSEFFRLAGPHGWPGKERRETTVIASTAKKPFLAGIVLPLL